MGPRVPPEEALQWVLGKIAAAKKSTAKPSPTFSLPKFEPPKAATLPVGLPKPDLKVTKAKEVELWKAWKDSGHKPEHLSPLLKSLDPLIQKKVNSYRNRVEIPTSALEFRARELAVDALKKYDPSKAQMNTYLTTKLKPMDRFVKTHQNMARIPENVARHIGTYNATKAELRDRLGHDPDDVALAEHSGLSMKMVKQLNKSLRKGLVDTGLGEDLSHTPNSYDVDMEVAHLIIPQLTPEERLVHQYSMGLNGNPQLKPGEIAKKLKMDNTKVAKLRSSIFKKMQPYLE